MAAQGHGKAGRGGVRQGHGVVGPGIAWHRKAGTRPGKAGRGEAQYGEARPGKAGRGEAGI
jgi:hypothetical protein